MRGFGAFLMKKYLFPTILTLLFGTILFVGAQTLPITKPIQGGTGIASTTPANVGKYIKVSDDSPFTYTLDTPASGAGASTTINGTEGPFTFATSSDTNLHLRVSTSSETITFTPSWAGTLADSRITSAATWNAKITTSSLSATAPILYNNVTGVFSLGITAVSSSRLISAGLGLTGGGDLSADRTFTLNMAGITCGGTDKVSSISATGTAICSTDQNTGGAGSGLSSTTPFSVGYIPIATTTNSLTNSNIFQSGSSIGIGTTTPAFLLTVDDGNATTTHVSIGAPSNPACMRLQDDDNGAYTYLYVRDGYMHSTSTKPSWCSQF